MPAFALIENLNGLKSPQIRHWLMSALREKTGISPRGERVRFYTVCSERDSAFTRHSAQGGRTGPLTRDSYPLTLSLIGFVVFMIGVYEAGIL